MQTISQILQNALASATKTASVTAPVSAPTPDVIDMIFDKQASAEPAKPAQPETPKQASAQASESPIALAAHGMKLARALDSAAELVKEAALTVTATPTGGTISVPPASNNSIQAKDDVPAPRVSGREMPTTEGESIPSGPQPTNHPSKSASLRLVNAKLADAEVLARYGAAQAAETLRKEAAELQKKADMDEGPSSNGRSPAMPTMASSMTGGGGGPSLSNERAINITRAEARNPTTAEMRQVITETPKVDPVTKAVVGSAEGVKASSLLNTIKKAQAAVLDTKAPAADRAKAAALLGPFAGKEG